MWPQFPLVKPRDVVPPKLYVAMVVGGEVAVSAMSPHNSGRRQGRVKLRSLQPFLEVRSGRGGDLHSCSQENL